MALCQIVSKLKNRAKKMPKNKKLALNSAILTNDDEVCIPSLSSILLAVGNTKSKIWIWRLADELVKVAESQRISIVIPHFFITKDFARLFFKSDLNNS